VDTPPPKRESPTGSLFESIEGDRKGKKSENPQISVNQEALGKNLSGKTRGGVYLWTRPGGGTRPKVGGLCLKIERKGGKVKKGAGARTEVMGISPERQRRRGEGGFREDPGEKKEKAPSYSPKRGRTDP